MSPFNARTGVSLLLLALTAVTATPASAGKFTKGEVAKVPPNGGVFQPLEPAPTPQPTPPPQVKGWPHSIVTGSATNCARNPGPNEVIVFRDPTFTGKCAVLLPGFYPFAANFVIGDDSLTSLKVGSAVRLRIFKHPTYEGDWTTYAPGTQTAGIGQFNDQVSSLRVEPADRSQNCDDLREGEIALYENPDFRGDCVVLPGEGSFADANSMGIEDDSISSIRNNSGRALLTFWHPSFNQRSIEIPPHSKNNRLPEGGMFTTGINDNISSIQMLNP